MEQKYGQNERKEEGREGGRKEERNKSHEREGTRRSPAKKS